MSDITTFAWNGLALMVAFGAGFYLAVMLFRADRVKAGWEFRNERGFLQDIYLVKCANEISREMLFRDLRAMDDCIAGLSSDFSPSTDDEKKHIASLATLLSVEFPLITGFDLSGYDWPSFRNLELSGLETNELVARYRKIMQILYATKGEEYIKNVQKKWGNEKRCLIEEERCFRLKLAQSILSELMQAEECVESTIETYLFLKDRKGGVLVTETLKIWSESRSPIPEFDFYVKFNDCSEVLGWTESQGLERRFKDFWVYKGVDREREMLRIHGLSCYRKYNLNSDNIFPPGGSKFLG